MVASTLERIPDFEERLVALLRHAKVSQLQDEIDIALLHIIDERAQALIRIVHDVLVDIGDQSEPQRRS